MFAFEEIVGNTRLIGALQAAIRHEQVGHAYIFDGQRGMGKTLVAKTFAKTLQCEERGVTPCGICKSCRMFDSGNHPDVLYPVPTKTKTLGVEDVREQINRAVETKPYAFRYKIFIVESAGEMSAAAQNALLKTLEEPPSYVVFLLLTDGAGLLLPTVLSRCVLYKLRPLPADDVAQHLMEQMQAPADAAHLAAVYAQGSLGRAAELATSADFAVLRERALSVFEGIGRRDLIELFRLAKELEAVKEQMQDVLDIGYMWFRDLAVTLMLGGGAYVLQRDLAARLDAEALTTDCVTVGAQLEAVWRAKRRLQQNGNFQMVMEVLLLDLSAEGVFARV